MKATGIVRKVDDLGRIVMPKELRDAKGFVTGTPMEIFVDGDTVIFKKYEPFCVFCGSNDNLVSYMGKMVCKHCIETMNR